MEIDINYPQKRINPPRLDEEVKLLAAKIEKELKINENLIFIKKVKPKIEWFTLPFSYYMASHHLNKTPGKVFTVMGIVETKEKKFVITKQRELEINIKGIRFQRKEHYSFSYAGFCKCGEDSENIIRENVYYELEEELGIMPEDVNIKSLIIDEQPTKYVLLAWLTTDLYGEEIKEIAKTAIDSWEITEIKLLEKEDALNTLEKPLRGMLEKLLK